MDFEAQRKQRQDALDEKRKRLEIIRKQRKEKEESNNSSNAAESIKEPPKPAAASTGSANDSRMDVDNLVQSLLSSSISNEKPGEKSAGGAPIPEAKTAPSAVVTTVIANPEEALQAKRDKLSTVKSTTYCHYVPEIPLDVYDKQTQTDEMWQLEDNSEEILPPQSKGTPRSYNSPKKRLSQGAQSLPSSPVETAVVEPTDVTAVPFVTNAPPVTTESLRSWNIPLARLSTDSRTHNWDIYRIADVASRAGVGKPLLHGSMGEEHGHHAGITAHRAVTHIEGCDSYSDVCAIAYGACITDVSSGSQPNESSGGLVCLWSLINMSNPPIPPVDGEEKVTGHLSLGPTAVCCAASPVLKTLVIQSPIPYNVNTSPNTTHLLVVGGCTSGQLLCWQVALSLNEYQRGRCVGVSDGNTAFPAGHSYTLQQPIQRSLMAGKGHTFPICYMKLLTIPGGESGGDDESLHFMTVSTDGLVCVWRLRDISEPVSRYYMRGNGQADGNVTCMTGDAALWPFSNVDNTTTDGDSASLHEDDWIGLYGSERGAISCGRCSDMMHTSMHHVKEVADAHSGFISSVRLHPCCSRSPVGLSSSAGAGGHKMHLPTRLRKVLKPLLLSSSLDWSVKLWNMGAVFGHQSTAVGAVNGAPPSPASALAMFSNSTYEYICDVQWCPVHPALFCMLSASGCVCVWNMNVSWSDPVLTIPLPTTQEDFTGAQPGGPASGNPGPLCWNTMQWLCDGSRIMVGSSVGAVCGIGLATSITECVRTARGHADGSGSYIGEAEYLETRLNLLQSGNQGVHGGNDEGLSPGFGAIAPALQEGTVV